MSAIRFTALGDSFVEGWGDPRPSGGLHGWVPRVATLLDLPKGSVRNLGVYGATTQDVVDRQLPRALANKSPLIGVVVGTNDLLRDYDYPRLCRNMRLICDSLTGADTTVVTATLPDIPGIMPISSEAYRRELRDRFHEANMATRSIAAGTGALCVELHRLPAWRDAAMWSADGLHPGPLGHKNFAEEMADLVFSLSGLVAA
jgi:lysophospholipase L1-like esterase